MSGGVVRLDIGGIAGFALGAARQRMPVVADGFVTTAGALIAAELSPLVKRYVIATHRSMEIGHGKILERLDQSPLLDLRLGEGTGAALGISLIEASLKVLMEMVTFADAGVSGKTKSR